MRLSILSALCLLTAPLYAGTDYKKDIKPIFEKRCVECHNQKMKSPKGGYVFDNVDRIKTEIGPSFLIRPGDPGNSDLMSMVTRANKDHPMPPDAKDALSPKEIKTLSDWIKEGALIDAPSGGIAKTGSGSSLPARSGLPVVKDWTNKEGKPIKAAFVKMIGEKVTLRMGGKDYEIPLSSLSEESQKLAMKTAGEMAVKVP